MFIVVCLYIHETYKHINMKHSHISIKRLTYAMRIKSKPQGKTESNAAKNETKNKDMKKSYGKYERK